MPTILISVSVSETDLWNGWDADLSEFAASVHATLHEVIGDDGGAYVPVVESFAPTSVDQ